MKFVSWLVCGCLTMSAAQAAGVSEAATDEFVHELLATGTPGLSLAIVKDDRVALARGYGRRDLNRREPVDADTLFGIASLTKAFTATSIAMLVDRGQLSFDTPLQSALPGFRVADPYVSANATLRDALSHRTGTARADLMWYANINSSSASLSRRLGALEQVASLRQQFEYSNLMYMVAGEVLAQRSGRPWEQFVSEEILTPLGMNRSTVDLGVVAGMANATGATDVAGAARGVGGPHAAGASNVAAPHIRSGGRIVQVPHDTHQNSAASGSIYSSANDMARWLRFLLNEGRLGTQALVKPESLAQTMTSQIYIGPMGPSDDLLFPRAQFIAYGMGWFVSDYRGHKMLSHTGSIDGMAALIALLPQQKLGVVVLSNLEGDLGRAALRNWVFDHYLGVNDTDWLSRYARWNATAEQHGTQLAQEQENAHAAGTQPSLPLARYARPFNSNLYGKLEIRLTADHTLEWRLADLPFAPLAHWHYNSFRIQWPTAAMNDPPYSLLSFQIDADGRAARALISGPAISEPVVFEASDR